MCVRHGVIVCGRCKRRRPSKPKRIGMSVGHAVKVARHVVYRQRYVRVGPCCCATGRVASQKGVVVNVRDNRAVHGASCVGYGLASALHEAICISYGCGRAGVSSDKVWHGGNDCTKWEYAAS